MLVSTAVCSPHTGMRPSERWRCLAARASVSTGRRCTAEELYSEEAVQWKSCTTAEVHRRTSEEERGGRRQSAPVLHEEQYNGKAVQTHPSAGGRRQIGPGPARRCPAPRQPPRGAACLALPAPSLCALPPNPPSRTGFAYKKFAISYREIRQQLSRNSPSAFKKFAISFQKTRSQRSRNSPSAIKKYANSFQGILHQLSVPFPHSFLHSWACAFRELATFENLPKEGSALQRFRL